MDHQVNGYATAPASTLPDNQQFPLTQFCQGARGVEFDTRRAGSELNRSPRSKLILMIRQWSQPTCRLAIDVPEEVAFLATSAAAWSAGVIQQLAVHFGARTPAPDTNGFPSPGFEAVDRTLGPIRPCREDVAVLDRVRSEAPCLTRWKQYGYGEVPVRAFQRLELVR